VHSESIPEDSAVTSTAYSTSSSVGLQFDSASEKGESKDLVSIDTPTATTMSTLSQTPSDAYTTPVDSVSYGTPSKNVGDTVSITAVTHIVDTPIVATNNGTATFTTPSVASVSKTTPNATLATKTLTVTTPLTISTQMASSTSVSSASTGSASSSSVNQSKAATTTTTTTSPAAPAEWIGSSIRDRAASAVQRMGSRRTISDPPGRDRTSPSTSPRKVLNSSGPLANAASRASPSLAARRQTSLPSAARHNSPLAGSPTASVNSNNSHHSSSKVTANLNGYHGKNESIDSHLDSYFNPSPMRRVMSDGDRGVTRSHVAIVSGESLTFTDRMSAFSMFETPRQSNLARSSEVKSPSVSAAPQSPLDSSVPKQEQESISITTAKEPDVANKLTTISSGDSVSAGSAYLVGGVSGNLSAEGSYVSRSSPTLSLPPRVARSASEGSQTASVSLSVPAPPSPTLSSSSSTGASATESKRNEKPVMSAARARSEKVVQSSPPPVPQSMPRNMHRSESAPAEYSFSLQSNDVSNSDRDGSELKPLTPNSLNLQNTLTVRQRVAALSEHSVSPVRPKSASVRLPSSSFDEEEGDIPMHSNLNTSRHDDSSVGNSLGGTKSISTTPDSAVRRTLTPQSMQNRLRGRPWEQTANSQSHDTAEKIDQDDEDELLSPDYSYSSGSSSRFSASGNLRRGQKPPRAYTDILNDSPLMRTGDMNLHEIEKSLDEEYFYSIQGHGTSSGTQAI
jgi:hypothetical protein